MSRYGDFKIRNNGGGGGGVKKIKDEGRHNGGDLKIGGNPFQSNFGVTKFTFRAFVQDLFSFTFPCLLLQ